MSIPSCPMASMSSVTTKCWVRVIAVGLVLILSFKVAHDSIIQYVLFEEIIRNSACACHEAIHHKTKSSITLVILSFPCHFLLKTFLLHSFSTNA